MIADVARSRWRRRGRRPHGGWLALGLLWVLGIGAGMKVLYDHQGRAGAAAAAPHAWPSRSRITRDPARPTLVMLAHPRCPCTRASIAELAILMTRLRERVDAHVLFVKPAGTGADFEFTDRWNSVKAIPGVRLHLDERGREAALFGAETSGQVVLYAPDGELMFAGGITSGRGHMGDNVGLERIVTLVEGGKVERALSSVFGCQLFATEEDS